jgi:hypothetical protein
MSLEQFRQHLLPASLSQENIKAVLGAIDIKALKEVVIAERKQVREGQGGNASKTIQEKDVPEQAKQTDKGERTEDTIETYFYKHITTIYELVAAAGRKVLQREEISKIHYNPGKSPISLESQNTSIPIYNLALSSTTSCQDDANITNVYCCDIFATCEFKKGDTLMDVYDVRIAFLRQDTITTDKHQKNHSRQIWNMCHIMREDPCRRFVFGISIENNKTRIWQANRAGVFVSDSFDYVDVRLFRLSHGLS